ncbi:hypothetical protein [Paracoccus aminophilus]|uniref:Uncharacterized protein n=1 Tax=Paracoccus aminophilus JCM 7686 TaxID=1367847 RepID=S5XL30_PARAH|nr:hypothetical protein [Paracoccus aminophilus]AGT07919.1 hypothetical protein JCM7686_0810 [Paracoccus aminophilus JCM 7686]
MPARRPSANPWNNPMMWEAARENLLIRLRCNGCRRSVYYWAADLVKVVGPYHQVHVPPWRCSRCKSAEFVEVHATYPHAELLGKVTIRRPVKEITRWIWRNEVGGEIVK